MITGFVRNDAATADETTFSDEPTLGDASQDDQSPTPQRRTEVLDVSEVETERVREYAADSPADGDVYLERKGGRTFLVTAE